MLVDLGVNRLHASLIEALTQNRGADLHLHTDFGSLVRYGSAGRLDAIGRRYLGIHVSTLQSDQRIGIAVNPFEQAFELIVPAFEFPRSRSPASGI